VSKDYPSCSCNSDPFASCHSNPELFALCHSERREESNPAQGKLCEESYGAQDRLREGEESNPCANTHGDKRPQSAIDILFLYS
jgi:hypothetical protein